MKNKYFHYISKVGERFSIDAHYFAKNTFWLLAGQALMSFAAFLSTVILANYVSKHDLGDFRLVVSIYTTLTFFVMSGLSAAFIRAVVQGYDGALEEALEIKKRYGLLTFLIGVCIALYFLYKGNDLFALLIIIMAAFLPLTEMYSMYVPYLQGKHEFKYSSLNTGIVKVVSSASVIAVTFIYPSTVWLVVAFFGSQALVTYIQYKLLIRKFPPENTKRDSNMLPHAKHLTLSGVGFLFFGQIDKYILYHFFGPIALASYWIASSVPQEFGRVVSTIGQVAFPKFVGIDHEKSKDMLAKRFTSALLILFVLSLIYAVIAYPFFYVFFNDYISEVPKSIFLMFGLAVIPYYFIWGYYTAKANHKITYFLNIVDPTLQVVLYLICIPFFGVWGLVGAVCLKTAIMNMLAWYILKKY